MVAMDDFSALVLSDIHHLSTSLISNPIYLSYFLFFSPSLLSLITFLSPLFLTTSLLLLTLLLTFSHHETDIIAIDTDTFHASKEALQVYNIVFDDSEQQVHHHFDHQHPPEAEASVDVVDVDADVSIEKPDAGIVALYQEEEKKQARHEVELSKELVFDDAEEQVHQDVDVVGDAAADVSISKPEVAIITLHHKEEKGQKVELSKAVDHSPPREESKGSIVFDDAEEQVHQHHLDHQHQHPSEPMDAWIAKPSHQKGGKVSSFTQLGSYQKEEKGQKTLQKNDSKDSSFTQLGSYGSMRKDKEWRRTLACKLFEERHHSTSSEGMDLLWEAHDHDETESDQKKNKNKNKGTLLTSTKSKKKSAGGSISSSNKIGHHCYEDDDEDNEEEDFETGWNDDGGGKLCCLQALKLSAGKMNLGGIGRPSLVKLTKAVKGFGWIHSTSSRHHSKKRIV
ncbi:hypothetical protein LINPERPRIM_LOCUS13638 [Linum perenne]